MEIQGWFARPWEKAFFLHPQFIMELFISALMMAMFTLWIRKLANANGYSGKPSESAPRRQSRQI